MLRDYHIDDNITYICVKNIQLNSKKRPIDNKPINPSVGRCTLITPSVLRVESEESIVVDAQGHNIPFDADILIQEFPQKKINLVTTKVSLNNNNNFLGTATVKIPADQLPNEPRKQYVVISVNSPSCKLEKVVLVFYHSGYIFIQTDKTIYTPGSQVLYRIYSMDDKMKPKSKALIVEFMNPDGMTVKRDTITHGNKTGIISLSHTLSGIVSLGVWTISAKYEDNPGRNYTANFEVKEYVLPTMEISLKPKKNFFYIHDNTFPVDIVAQYLYGKPVHGFAFVLFGVGKDNVKKGIPESMQRLQLEDGEGRAELKRETLDKYFRNRDEMLEYSLYMTVSVITDTGSGMVDAQLDNIYMVTSPYKVLFTKASKYFKPGMPFDMMVLVTNPDGSPAIRISVVAEPGGVQGTTQADGTAKLTLNTESDIDHLHMTVKTNHTELSAEHQASSTMTAIAYHSTRGQPNYLHINIAGSKIKHGEIIPVTFNIRNDDSETQNQIQHFTYLLVVTGYRDRDNVIHEPSSQMKLSVRANHNANVGLVAVDKGAQALNSKFKLTQNKVWDSVEKSDIGCTSGSGTDGPSVFYDAGLALQTSFSITTAQRSEPHCEVHPIERKRVSGAMIEIEDSKASHYKDQARRCCRDGMQENLMGHSCERRSRLILDGKECVDAFLDCCYEQDRKRKLLHCDDDNDDDEYKLDDEIVSRTGFLESWLWTVEPMAEEPNKNGISTKVLNISLKDFITTWEVLAVSLSETKGLCVAQPYEIKVMKDFFIDLKLPYSVVRNEQVEIRAVLYNYRDERIKVRVELIYNREFCSMATAKKKFRQEVYVVGQSSTVVPFTIVPLNLGEHEIEVKAAASGTFASDGVRKKLKVVPEGIRVVQTVASITLDPEAKGKDGVQEENIKALHINNIVLQTEIENIILLQGTPISQMVEDAIVGNNLNHLIVVPGSCGEQNMITMTPSVIATIYLDATDQWELVGVNRRDQALANIRRGYGQQLTFRKKDNSYAAWIKRPSSTWLTAFVVKVFAMARDLTDIDDHVLCGAVNWLILQKQKPNGQFEETAPAIHQEMVGGITDGGSEPDVTLTAFVVIAMLESRKTCDKPLNTLQNSIDKAVTFLSNQYPTLQKPYSIAITSYALALAGKLHDPKLLMAAAKDNRYWEVKGSHFISLEATSYALLALLKIKIFDQTNAIVRWLNEQRYYGEVHGSTQAAMVMFQALAQYQADVPTLNELNLDVSLHLPTMEHPIIYQINPQTALLARSVETKTNKDFVVTAKGKGQGTLRVMSVYHAFVTANEMKCNHFDLTVKVKNEPVVSIPDGAKSTMSIEICTRFLKNIDATMSVIDVSMMTGFSPDVDSLDKLMNGVDRYISKYEINQGANEKGTLILYVDKISHTEEECVKFYTHQFFEVGLIQPASVTVYDYYTPENRCTKFYHMEDGSALLGRICQAEVCRCAEENCFLQQNIEGKITALRRMEMACEPGVDYVYKATITNIEYNDNYNNYVMSIKTVIKEGTDEDVKGKFRNFISHVKCRKALDLQKGRDYLIWGVTGDLWNQPSGYSYIIGKDTWIEWWPSEKECRKHENQDLCDDFDTLSANLEITGCQT
ncbi:hypothetical protein GDO86_007009 [Hymenochirus boettgeri]|uniref:Complement C3 n=1 Tax=Hymenochirus boettgeri TaxID=247094 RepID=A0A8T2JFW8_9PIPI|nr:hypothetical protein GDO86_007009 [Hymenochirus boettgeri]